METEIVQTGLQGNVIDALVLRWTAFYGNPEKAYCVLLEQGR